MEYLIDKQDYELLNKLVSKSRFSGSEVNELKRFYDKYINKYLKKNVDWKCPRCVRECLGELQNFIKKSTIKDENKNNKRKRSKKGGESSK